MICCVIFDKVLRNPKTDILMVNSNKDYNFALSQPKHFERLLYERLYTLYEFRAVFFTALEMFHACNVKSTDISNNNK